jgi:hypothetical protein
MGLDDTKESEPVDADGLVKKKVLDHNNPVFKKDRISSKVCVCTGISISNIH